jgi:predicted CXXCH cytochrome family protein
MSRRVILPPLAAAACALALAFAPVRAQQADSFPHSAHAKVFPSCTGCHAGIVSGDAKTTFPDPSTCQGCHDGQQRYEGRVLKAVTYKGGSYPATNLKFSHVEHAKETNTTASTRACVTCHQRPGDTAFMAVAGPAPALCLDCHEHAAPSHLADAAKCRTCHVPLAQATTLTAASITKFPKPASHDSKDFLLSHAPADSAALSRCAVCHTQESCARCHITTASAGAVAVLGSNPTVAVALAGKPANYPVPPSHAAADFQATHGKAARANPATCANCHAQSSCETCHLKAGAGGVIAKLPVPHAGGAQGVQLRSTSDFALFAAVAFRAPSKTAQRGRPDVWSVRVHDPGFAKNHRAVASTASPNCLGCHKQVYCADCHDGVGRLKYHTADYVQGHAASAYGREQDCAACHNSQAFCLSCHQKTGLAANGSMNGVMHNQSPNWLLQHGEAARLSLPNCISCHKQSDCIKCHSTTTWGINPHGPNFDANRMAKLNTQICYYCHVTNPVSGNLSR